MEEERCSANPKYSQNVYPDQKEDAVKAVIVDTPDAEVPTPSDAPPTGAPTPGVETKKLECAAPTPPAETSHSDKDDDIDLPLPLSSDF